MMSGLKTGFANKRNWGLFQLGIKSGGVEKRRKKKKTRAKSKSKKAHKNPTLAQLEIQYLHLAIDAEIAGRPIPPIPKSTLLFLQAHEIERIPAVRSRAVPSCR